jgi:hypothetical protein
MHKVQTPVLTSRALVGRGRVLGFVSALQGFSVAGPRTLVILKPPVVEVRLWWAEAGC